MNAFSMVRLRWLLLAGALLAGCGTTPATTNPTSGPVATTVPIDAPAAPSAAVPTVVQPRDQARAQDNVRPRWRDIQFRG
jgi:hypothetical protein